MLAEASGLRYLGVGDWVKEQGLHCGWDEEHQSFTLDEDKVLDAMEEQMSEGANIVDFHSSDFFPERWFDLVVVLTTDNTVLYGRLESRGYHQAKIQENVQCEIMHVSIEEARAAYKPDIVKFLSSNTLEDMSANIQTIQSLLADYDAETN